MREIIESLLELHARRVPLVYCRLVETRGSTPQKAGAAMLVLADGDQRGTLGGGCVEAEVKRQALAVLHDHKPQVARFVLDHDYGWDDGLICGGRMDVVIEPVGVDTTDYFRLLHEFLAAGRAGTEAIYLDQRHDQNAAPSYYLFDDDQRLVTSLGREGAPDLATIAQGLQPVSNRLRPYTHSGIAYLPIPRRTRLIIVGAGHVGKAVADLTSELGFDVWVVDDRADMVSLERFPRAERRISGQIHEVLPELEITENTYCLIVTRGHNHDAKALYYLADRGAAYVGLIGSRRKIKLIFADLISEGIAPEALERVYAPVGIDIGSQTVPEIAVSIAAELVAHRNLRGRVPGRLRDVSTSSQHE